MKKEKEITETITVYQDKGRSYIRMCDVVGAVEFIFKVEKIIEDLRKHGMGKATDEFGTFMQNQESRLILESIELSQKKEVMNYYDRLTETIKKLPLDKIESLKKAIVETQNKGGTIYSMGNGGSGATASHVAGDYVKSLGYNFRCLNDNVTAMTAIGNDIGYEKIFSEQLKNINGNDLIILISGSGGSKNIWEVLNYFSRERHLNLVLIYGFDNKNVENSLYDEQRLFISANDMEQFEDLSLSIFHKIKQELMKEEK